MRSSRATRIVVLAATLAIGLVPALGPAPAAAATPKLTIVGDATYDVLPDEGRVAVTVALTATNHLTNTATKRFFFRTAILTVLPGTSGFKLTASSGKPKVSVTKRTDTYTNLKLDFGANLGAGKSTTLALTFDIKDPGGAPDRPVRISPSLVSFGAWAYATPETPGASVRVRFPTGYAVAVGRGPLDGPASDGEDHEVWSSGTLAAPLDYVADIVADRPGETVETALDVPLAGGSAPILLHAWPDDPEWRDRVADLVRRALPVLEREIGVPWPVEGALSVDEALVRTTGGYAGLFDPAERRIEIAYAAPDGVVLHELAHAWFNGSLVADRWTAEGFASYYAALAAAELGVEPDAPAPPPEDGVAEIPLNDWGPTGSQDPDVEAFAYAASRELAEAIADRAGPATLQGVWAKASAGVGAYQPSTAAGPVPPSDAVPTELAEGPPDWRGLLDLLEDSTGLGFDDLWRSRVARPVDVPALDARIAARAAYAASVAGAGEWRLPALSRAALRAWQFDAAGELLEGADSVIAQWRALEAAATAAGLTLPDRVHTAFEGDGGIEAAAAEARAEQAVVDAINRARAAEPTDPGVGERLITVVGLIGVAPSAEVAAAEDFLAGGDVEAAYAAALHAEAAWTEAPRVGRSRIVSVLLLVLAWLVFAALVWRQRRRRRAVAPA